MNLRKTFTWAAGALALFGAVSTTSANQVTAQLEGSLLVIAGDNVANQIAVTRNAAGDVIVAGQNGTQVNGRPSVTYRRAALNAAEIDMGGGNDIVALRNVQIANDLFVKLGDGNDRLTVPAAAPLMAGVTVTVEGNGGNDVVRLESAVVGIDLYVDGGIGVLNTVISNSAVGGVVSVIGDAANDIVTLTKVSALGDVYVEVKEGSDSVTLNSVDCLLLGIATDANAVAGADRVKLNVVTTVEDLGIFTGPGKDVVEMLDVASSKNMVVSVDAGADRVTGMNVSADFDAVFEGGADTDTLENLGIIGGTKLDFKEFEIFLP